MLGSPPFSGRFVALRVIIMGTNINLCFGWAAVVPLLGKHRQYVLCIPHLCFQIFFSICVYPIYKSEAFLVESNAKHKSYKTRVTVCSGVYVRLLCVSYIALVCACSQCGQIWSHGTRRYSMADKVGTVWLIALWRNQWHTRYISITATWTLDTCLVTIMEWDFKYCSHQ